MKYELTKSFWYHLFELSNSLHQIKTNTRRVVTPMHDSFIGNHFNSLFIDKHAAFTYSKTISVPSRIATDADQPTPPIGKSVHMHDPINISLHKYARNSSE